jgi:hypothetical protein
MRNGLVGVCRKGSGKLFVGLYQSDKWLPFCAGHAYTLSMGAAAMMGVVGAGYGRLPSCPACFFSGRFLRSRGSRSEVRLTGKSEEGNGDVKSPLQESAEHWSKEREKRRSKYPPLRVRGRRAKTELQLCRIGRVRGLKCGKEGDDGGREKLYHGTGEDFAYSWGGDEQT